MVIKRIHPYLFSSPTEDILKEMKTVDWEKPLNTHEYAKAFYFDSIVTHDFSFRYFIQNYAITTDLLRYSTEDSCETEWTLYAFSQRMNMTLKEFVEYNDNEKGIGCYNALVVLLRLAFCLNHCYQYELVHNDIKMDNIMIPDDQNPTDVRLIDFGEGFVGFDQLSSSPVLRKGNVHYKYSIVDM